MIQVRLQFVRDGKGVFLAVNHALRRFVAERIDGPHKAPEVVDVDPSAGVIALHVGTTGHHGGEQSAKLAA